MMMMMLLSLLRCLEIQAGRGKKTCLYEEEKCLLVVVVMRAWWTNKQSDSKQTRPRNIRSLALLLLGVCVSP